MRNRASVLLGMLAVLGIGLLLLVSPVSFTAEPVTVFGPERFVRDNGAPQHWVRSFELPRRAPDCTLIVDNGDKPATRVTSGTILLNGRLVVGPSEFKKTIPQIRKSVRLWKRNRLTVSVAGQPGVFLVTTLRCTPSNTRPVADAGPDQTTRIGDVVTLDGTGSTDADGDALSYTWTLRGPSGSGAVLSDPHAVQPTFTVDQSGAYTARLVVNDGQLNSRPDAVAITTENAPPVADAGPDQTSRIGDLVTLDGGGSHDVDGDALTYHWSLTVPTGSRAALSDPSAVKPTFTIDQLGTYIARLVVNDGRADSESDEVVVSTENSPPVADAGPDQTARVGATVTLDGSGSSDADGDPLTFEWSLLEVPSGSAATLSDPSAVHPTLVLDRPGVYVAQLLVSDGVAEHSDTVTITTENSPPVANAGPDQSGRVGTTITLDGSGSSDVDGDALTYTWSLTDRPAGSGAALSDPHAIQPHFELDRPGHYVAQLRVSDGTAESSDTVEIATVNSPPVADAGPDQTVAVGATVTLDGDGSHDVDGDALTYEWALLNTPTDSIATLSDPTAVRPSFVADLPGTYLLQLIVHDGTEASAPDSVEVTTENSRPVADAGPDQQKQVGDTVTVDGTASRDADGDPLTYRWSLIDRPLNSTVTLSYPTPAQARFVPDLAGDYVAQLIVNDGTLDSVPDTALVTVTDLTPSNNPPTITSTAIEQASVDQLYQYQVTATDPDAGDVLRYALPVKPEGMTIGTTTGLIGWTPTLAQAGEHEVRVEVSDQGGLSAAQAFKITVAVATTNQAPQVSAGDPQTITLPDSASLSGTVTDDGLPDPPGALTVTWSKDDSSTGAGTVTFDPPNAMQTTATFSAAGTYVLKLTASDGDQSASDTVTVTVNAETLPPLPPDPSTVAPKIDATVATTTFAATEFLYTGSNPIQTGVAPGTIEAKRAAVIRGQVLDKQNQPLPGVTVSILNHPEFGQTISRADGWFDLAVNGGGYLTLNYQRSGYLPAQRQVNAPWQDFVLADDVVLLTADSQVTTIYLMADTFDIARGSAVSDTDGTRQATLVFPPYTTATMTLADGSTQSLSTLQVRATEYTVGANGPQAMPAELPPTSAYTYAVELSVDEALAAGAMTVQFNQAIPFYVDNFLNFPVGIQVPVAYYDREKSAWIPTDDGRIIQILRISRGVAQVDTTGDGVADNGVDLGMTEAERQALAQSYTAGQSLQRVAVQHLTPYDLNYGVVPKSGAEQPQPSAAQSGDQHNPDSPNTSCGSIIGCENQTLGEVIGVTGTPFHLSYVSDRVPGRIASSTLTIPLSGTSVPSVLKRIELEITVAGRTLTQSFPAAANQTYTFTWDGQDAYGRTLQGAQPINIRIGYVYDGYYALPPSLASTFGAASGERIAGDIAARREVTLWQDQQTSVSILDFQKPAIGGWSLDVHHDYDPLGRVLYQGDGSRRSTTGVANNIVTTVAGNGVPGFSGDGGLATQATLNTPLNIAVAADGSIYIVDFWNYRIRRIGPDGIITTVAGSRFGRPGGDDGPATQATISPSDIAVAADGSVYIGDGAGSVSFPDSIRRIGPDGIITTIAGNGTSEGYSGDGGPATQASLNGPTGFSVAKDGSLYFCDSGNNRIRRIGPDGIITTVAGGGSIVESPLNNYGEGLPATQLEMSQSLDVAIAADGSLLLANFGLSFIRKVGLDGIYTTIAGTGHRRFDGDGSLATQTSLNGPLGIALANDGSVLVADTDNNRIRRIGPDGVITTIAGNGQSGLSGDGGPATQVALNQPRSVAVAADGGILIADTDNHRILKVFPPLPGFDGGSGIFITSTDGRLLYRFSPEGRHLSTVDTLTKAVLYTFGYDSDGRLTSITDADNNVTTIERDGSGNPTAIIAPFGQRTRLTLNRNGYLARVTNPASEAYQLTYTASGLLTAFTDPNGHTSTMTYDALGRLLKDTNAASGSQTLARTELTDGFTATRTTALNRTTTYTVEDLSTGDRQRKVLAPDGTETVTLIGTDGSTKITAPDGTVTETLDGPDPRFGMQSPVTTSSTVTTGGLTATTSSTATVDPEDPTNPLDFTTLTRTATVNGRTATTTFDAATRRATATSPAGRQSYSVLDAKGRVTESGVTGIDPVQKSYDSQGRLISVTQGTGSDARTTTFSYNAAGYLQSATDALGQSGQLAYDAAGRVLTQTLANGQSIGFAYDAKGNLTSLTPPGQPAHTFTYNAVDLATAYTPPSVTGSGTTSTLYQYNADQQVTQITRPDGGVIEYDYDSVGRLSTLSIPAGQYGYSYNSVGKLDGITAPGSIALDYTHSGSLLTQVTWSGEISGYTDYGYDNDFRVTWISVNGANPITYAYDADSLLTEAGDLTLTHDVDNGLLTGTALGNATESYSYNSFGEMSGYTGQVDGANLLSFTYTRDKLGRITEKAETVEGVTTTYAYSYDAIGQLVEVKQNGSVTATYSYDANGNRLSKTGTGIEETGTYDAQDRMLSYDGATYSYNANGEIQSKTEDNQTTSYSYDALGNLRQVTLPDSTQIDYVIDGQNRRIGKKINGALVQGFLYQGQLQPAAELDGSGNVVSRFVYATGVNVPDYLVKGGVTYRIFKDHLGSPRLVVDIATGTVAQRLDYDEYGQVINDTNPGFQPFWFAGGIYDRDTGLVRFGARDYEAGSGRWMAKDLGMFQSKDIDLYRYTANDPVNFVDRNGMQTESPDPLGLGRCKENPDYNDPDEMVKRYDRRAEGTGKGILGGTNNIFGSNKKKQEERGECLRELTDAVPIPVGKGISVVKTTKAVIKGNILSILYRNIVTPLHATCIWISTGFDEEKALEEIIEKGLHRP